MSAWMSDLGKKMGKTQGFVLRGNEITEKIVVGKQTKQWLIVSKCVLFWSGIINLVE